MLQYIVNKQKIETTSELVELYKTHLEYLSFSELEDLHIFEEILEGLYNTHLQILFKGDILDPTVKSEVMQLSILIQYEEEMEAAKKQIMKEADEKLENLKVTKTDTDKNIISIQESVTDKNLKLYDDMKKYLMKIKNEMKQQQATNDSSTIQWISTKI
jgi:hypothetical protein